MTTTTAPPRSVTFGIVDPDKGREAYQWHRGFTGANENVYARPWGDYEKLAERGQVMCATDEHDDYVGLCYFMFEKRKRAWEIGGMMVAQQQRGRGVGAILGRVTLAHILFEEDPLSRNETVIARVVDVNRDPRPLLEEKPGAFKKIEGAMNVPANELSGVRTNQDGYVVGDQYDFEPKIAAVALAEWCKEWSGTLKDGSAAHIRMRPGVTMSLWERAFRDMAG